MLFKVGALTNFVNFTAKHLGCLVKYAKFLRTPPVAASDYTIGTQECYENTQQNFSKCSPTGQIN